MNNKLDEFESRIDAVKNIARLQKLIVNARREFNILKSEFTAKLMSGNAIGVKTPNSLMKPRPTRKNADTTTRKSGFRM